MSDLHPTKIPALVDALEAKVSSDPRSDVDKAYDEAIEILRDIRSQCWASARAVLDTAVAKIVAAKEASHG
jgi:hypothetical protein